MEEPLRTRNGESVIQLIERVKKEHPELAKVTEKYARELVEKLRGEYVSIHGKNR